MYLSLQNPGKVSTAGSAKKHVVLTSAEGGILPFLISNSICGVRGLHGLIPGCVYTALAPVCPTGHDA